MPSGRKQCRRRRYGGSSSGGYTRPARGVTMGHAEGRRAGAPAPQPSSSSSFVGAFRAISGTGLFSCSAMCATQALYALPRVVGARRAATARRNSRPVNRHALAGPGEVHGRLRLSKPSTRHTPRHTELRAPVSRRTRASAQARWASGPRRGVGSRAHPDLVCRVHRGRGQDEGARIGEPHILCRKPHQPPTDVDGVVAAFEHPHEPVQACIRVARPHALEHCVSAAPTRWARCGRATLCSALMVS